MTKLKVIIPALNEERSIGELIKIIKQLLKTKRISYEIIVVDDGSTDSTAIISKKNDATVLTNRVNFGVGNSIRKAHEYIINNGNGEIIVQLDADGQHFPQDIIRLIEPIANNKADLVIGSRFLKIENKMDLIKKLGNKLLSFMVGVICGKRITDSQSGFRAYSKDILDFVHLENDFTYCQEMIIQTIKNGFRVKEISIKVGKRKFGKSKVVSSILKYIMKIPLILIRSIMMFDPLKIFVPFSLLLFGIGFFEALREVIIDFNVGDVPIFFMLSGILIFFFGLVADQNALIKRRIK